MKRIEAIIRKSKLGEVRTALKLHGVVGMTITEVWGVGHDTGPILSYRGATRAAEFVPRVKVETVVEDDHADEAIDAIFCNAHTGDVGDGRIYVSDVGREVRIRTGEILEAHHQIAG